MTTTQIIIIVLVLVLLGVMPVWPYSQRYAWGWGPSGILGVLLVILLVLMLAGKL